MVSMCTIVATTMSMPMTGSGAAVTAADHMADEQVCGMGASTECTAVAVTVGLALFGLLFMLLRQRSYLVVVMRSLITTRRKTWRPPRLHLTPIRFQLCVMRK